MTELKCDCCDEEVDAVCTKCKCCGDKCCVCNEGEIDPWKNLTEADKL